MMATIDEVLAQMEAAKQASPPVQQRTVDSVLAEMEAAKTGAAPVPQQPPQQQESPGVLQYLKQAGSGITRGAMDMLDMPANVLNIMGKGAADIVGLPEEYRPDPIMRTSDIPAIKDFVERGTAPAIPKGQSAIADMLRTGAEWAVPLGKFGKTDVLMGSGAALGEQAFDEIGEMAGGLMGMLGGSIRGKPKMLQDDYEKASEFIRDNARNPEEAIANYQAARESGEVGTFADLTKDPGIYNLETTVKPGTPIKARLDELGQQRTEQQTQQISEQLGPEVPYRAMEDVSQKAGERTGGLEQAIAQREARQVERGVAEVETQLPRAQEEVTAAQRQVTEAEQVAERALPDVKPSVASKELSEVYAKSEADFKTNVEKPAWDEFSQGRRLDAEEIKVDFEGKIDELTGTEAIILDQKFGPQMNMIRQWDEMVAPDEVHTVISEIKSINANARKSDDFTNANRLLQEVGETLEGSLKTLGDSGTYERAVAASREKFERFKPSRVGKERGKLEAETLGRRLLDTKEGGAVVGDLIGAAKSPEITQAAEGYIKSIAKRDGVDDAFMKNYDELLDRFPALRDDLTAAKKAQEDIVTKKTEVTEAEKVVEGLPKAMETQRKEVITEARKKATGLSESVSKTQVAKLKSNPEKFIDDALVNKSVEDLVKVEHQVSRVPGGKESLKTAIKERILGKITKTKAGESQIPMESIGAFDAMKRNLLDSGILTKAEVTSIEKTLGEAKQTTKLRQAAANQKADKASSVIKEAFATASAIGVLKMLPTVSNQLMLAGFVRRSMGKQTDKLTDKQKMYSAVEDILSNPEKYVQEMSKANIKTQAEMDQFLLRMGRAVSQSVAEE